MATDNKVLIVTRKTRLDELIHRFNTRQQAQFYVEHNGLDFADYLREHETYAAALAKVRRGLEAVGGGRVRVQAIDRGFLPSFVFDGVDAVIAVGQDGLVANTAKYVDGRPLVGVNPDPGRFDGVLLPFTADTAAAGVERVLTGAAAFHEITMAEAVLNDGQRLLAFNEFLVGRRDHVSARYLLTWGKRTEQHSGSGVLVSTGAGSTGWLSSTRNMAVALGRLLGADKKWDLPPVRMAWDDPRLMFVVREPFASKVTGVELAAGYVAKGESLKFESRMPEGGAIFSDGLDADALAFNSGAVATIRAAKTKTRLVRQ